MLNGLLETMGIQITYKLPYGTPSIRLNWKRVLFAEAMDIKYRIVRLGRDFKGVITSFAAARNHFLSKYEWVLFIDDDEEACDMLLEYIDGLEPKYPYYWIRRLNLLNGRYRALWNPEYSARLVSNKVKFVGDVHERVVPKDPHGVIDFPIVHNHIGPSTYRNYWYQDLPVYRFWLGIKKMAEVVRDR